MGYARWATKEEMLERLEGVNLETGVKQSGLPVAYDDKYLYIDEKEAHNLIIGCSGSGKTQAIILPLIKLSMMAKESVLVNDPKGELYKDCAAALEKNGYNVLALDFDDAAYGNSWNPLKMSYDLYKDGKYDKAIKCLEDTAYYLFYEKDDSNVDPFWTNSATDYFIGLTLYLFENAKEDEVHLESVSNLSAQLSKNSCFEEFIKKIDSKSKIFVHLSGILLAPSETRASIISVFNQKVRKYISREQLSNMLCSSDFDLNKICTEPTALFIISGISNYSNNLIPLLVDQVIETVNILGKSPKHFNLLLDEFDSMVPIRDFAKMIEMCRSMRIRITVTVRSYVHLCSMYSKEETEILKMCFGNIVYLLSEDIYTLEEISKSCGMQLVNNKFEPLVSIEDLKLIGVFEGIVIAPRMMPYKTKFLPDYQIDWGIEFEEKEIPARKVQSIHYYEEV